MQVPASSQMPPTVTVDNSATVVRGFSTEVRSDVPPVQQGDGVRYTRGRPSDNETVELYGNGRKKGEANGRAAADSLASPAQSLASQNLTGQAPLPAEESGEQARGAGDTEERLASETSAVSGENESLETPAKVLQEEKGQATLNAEDQALVEQLKKRDREVRLHELAHQAAGGRYAGSASYDYQRGPDGRNYAVGGEVSIDVATTDNLEETIQKAKQIRAAALAPPQPSAQDRRVAQEAEQMIADAQQELRAQEREAAKADLQARNDKLRENAEEEAAKQEAQTQSEKRVESGEVEKKTVVTATVASEKPAEKNTKANDAADDGNQEKKPVEAKERVTAREALEKILLAGQSLTTQANAAGYISPEAPAGQSGLLDVVI